MYAEPDARLVRSAGVISALFSARSAESLRTPKAAASKVKVTLSRTVNLWKVRGTEAGRAEVWHASLFD